MWRKVFPALVVVMLAAAGCGHEKVDVLASGAFESVEVIVSSEAAGKILELRVEEGATLAEGEVVGRLDCDPLRPENLDLQLKRCRIVTPVSGTVLVKYAEAGEVAGVGKPLFKLADTRTMILRAYLTADQISVLKVGDMVPVQADFETEGLRDYEGRVVWISSKAEFTPKTIQTRNERANLVYAVKIAVPNDGYLKLGMYGVIPGAAR